MRLHWKIDAFVPTHEALLVDTTDRAATEARVAQQSCAGLVISIGGPHRPRSVTNATHVRGVVTIIFQSDVLRQYHSALVAFVGELCEPRRGVQPRELQERIASQKKATQITKPKQ